MSIQAEDFVDILAQKNLVSSEFVDGLRRRLAQRPGEIPANVFAARLVEEGVLPSSLADALLRQLEHREPTAVPPSQPVPPPFPPPRVSAVPPMPAPPVAPAFSGESAAPDRFQGKGFSRKKKSKNPWDTKLILFGGAGLFLLVLSGLFLTGSLSRRGAETMYAAANEMYGKGNYSQAIIDYSAYLSAYPGHSGASIARVRLALARIRLIVDAGSDWIKAFETVETEIAGVKDETVFFDESKAELAVLLPKIVFGLAAEAKEKTSLVHAEQGERALALVDELLPRSLRPIEKLAEAQLQLDGVRRLLARDGALEETRKQLDARLAATPFDAEQVARCFETVDSLLERYPELENEEIFLEQLRRLAEAEAGAVQTISVGEGAGSRSGPESAPAFPPLSSLYFRTFRKEASTLQSDRSASIFVLYAAGSVFALRSSDGTPLWRKPVATTENSSAPGIVPLPSTGADSRPSVLLVDRTANRIDRLDSAKGDVLWSFSFDERFFLSEPVEVASRTLIAVSTVSGRLLTFAFGAGPEPAVHAVRLPRATDSAPLVDPVGRRIFQFAERATLFSLPIDASGEVRSFFTDHKASTLRIPPLCFENDLLFVRQTGVGSGEGVVFSTENGVLQRFPIQGLVDTPMVRDGAFVALTSDEGESTLLERLRERPEGGKQAFRLVARGSAGAATERRGTVRYTILDDKTVWVADRQLMRFETQLSQSRLFPRDSVCRDIVTVAAPYRSGRVLLHPFRRPGLGGLSVEAVSLDDASVLWETEIADPIVLEPRFDEASPDSLTVHTSTGKSYRIDLKSGEQTGRFLGAPVDQLQRGIFANHPLGSVVPLRNGFAAWIPRVDPQRADQARAEPVSGNRLIMIFDPEAPVSTRFKTLLLSTPFAAPPGALDGNLLIPLRDGRIVLIDPKTRESAANSLIPAITERGTPRWAEAAIDAEANELLIVDNTPDRAELHRIVLQTENGTSALRSRNRLPLNHPVIAPPALFGNKIVLLDERNTLHVVRRTENGLESERSEPSSLRRVWGPHAVAGRVFWATSDLQLHALDADSKRTSIASPLPVGNPFSDKNGVLLNSGTGTLWNLDPDSLTILFSMETGVRTSVGPVRAGGRMFVSGNDGAVYDIKEPLRQNQ